LCTSALRATSTIGPRPREPEWRHSLRRRPRTACGSDSTGGTPCSGRTPSEPDLFRRKHRRASIRPKATRTQRRYRVVKHLKRVGDLGKKEPSLAIVRPDGGCIGDNKQNMLGHGVAPALVVKRLVNIVRNYDSTFTADILT